MALHSDLPIFKLTSDMLDLVMDQTKQFKREWRYLGARLNDECIELTILIYRANSSGNKRHHLNEFLERVKVVELMLRLAVNKRLLAVKNYGAIVELTQNIGRQATGWRNKSPAA